MLQTTEEAIRAVLRADPSITRTDRAAMLDGLRNHGRTESEPVAPRLLRRAEAARRLSVTTRAIDVWAKQGILQKVRLPGRARASGFRESDIATLIEGRNNASA